MKEVIGVQKGVRGLVRAQKKKETEGVGRTVARELRRVIARRRGEEAEMKQTDSLKSTAMVGNGGIWVRISASPAEPF